MAFDIFDPEAPQNYHHGHKPGEQQKSYQHVFYLYKIEKQEII